MYYFIEHTSFVVLIVMVIAFLGFLIYGFFDIKNKIPGHPGKYLLFSSIPVISSILVIKYSFERYGTESLFAEIFTFVSVLIAYISFVVIFIVSHKKGYTNRRLFKQNKYIIIITAFAIGAAIVFWGIKMFNAI